LLTTNIPKTRIPGEDYEWLREECLRLLSECRVEASDGTVLYRPDGGGHYDALWTRDFCYMVEGARALIPQDHTAAGIDYLLARQREDGAVPDRVGADGVAVFTAGPADAPLGTQPPTDNPQFLVKLTHDYVWSTNDVPFVEERLERLWRALESVPTQPDGAVYVDPAAPHSSYGFTDTIAKTGAVLFSTLLLWEAWQLMGKLGRRCEDHEAAHEAYEKADKTHRALGQFWDEGRQAFIAATGDCRQVDVWGNAYAVRIGAVGSSHRHRIAQFLAEAYDAYALRGHVRHLLAGEYWERLLIPVEPDTYQNGGYWAVPSGWVARCLAGSDRPELAGRLARQLIDEFREGGVCEWISETQRAVPGYVASAALLLDAVKAEGR
jgi:hypothetical protein